jgi:hypothetical protein
MRKHKSAAAGLAAALALAAPGLAQQPQAPAAGTPMSAFLRQQSADQWRGSRLLGATVYGADNNSIGEVDDLLIGRNGEVLAVVVGFGEKNVALPFAALTIKRMQGSNAIDKIVVGYSKQQLDQAPRFAFDGEARSQTTGAGDASNVPSAQPR